MTKFFTVSSLACCLALSWSIGYAQTTTKTVKPYAYSMKVTVSRPKGSSAEEVALLLSAGADVNALDDSHASPLTRSL